MKILVACEESQTACKAFRARGHEPYVNGGCKDAHGNYRKFQGRKERNPKIRSKTFPGIAEAMADQWGCLHD
jgi:hypothetical protein